MKKASDIPVLEYIDRESKLPNQSFEESKRGKALNLFYSILSRKIGIQIPNSKHYLISRQTLNNIKEQLNKIDKVLNLSIEKPLIYSLTVEDQNDQQTLLVTAKIIDLKVHLNLLEYNGLLLNKWIGGILDNGEIHLSVKYPNKYISEDNDEHLELLNIFYCIYYLKTLTDFELIQADSSKELTIALASKIGESELIRIDLSYLREYLIPTLTRREHYRWQYCGPGRTVLKRIKIKESIVKEHMRGGKRMD